MEPIAFDTLARAIAQTGNRRGLLRLLAAIPLFAVAATVDSDAAGAERPNDRLQGRTPQRNKKQRNQRRRNNKNNNNGNNKGAGESCAANGNLCSQDSDCCSANCFSFVCADRVSECSAGGGTRQCVPPAKGCAGGICCYGSVACGNTCCELPANQCNPDGFCCAPNCDGRQCGPDGCGAGGTCQPGCKDKQTCSSTGQCQGTPTCAQSCKNGCCDAQGNCQPGNTVQACGTGGAQCQACPSAPPDETATCANGVCGATCNIGPCKGKCCPSGQHCFPDGCCTAIYDPCTADSQCCSFPRSTCKTVGSSQVCCGVSNVSVCHSNDQCCSGVCHSGTLTCA